MWSSCLVWSDCHMVRCYQIDCFWSHDHVRCSVLTNTFFQQKQNKTFSHEWFWSTFILNIFMFHISWIVDRYRVIIVLNYGKICNLLQSSIICSSHWTFRGCFLCPSMFMLLWKCPIIKRYSWKLFSSSDGNISGLYSIDRCLITTHNT